MSDRLNLDRVQADGVWLSTTPLPGSPSGNVTPHDLLGPSHSDTTTDSPTEGSLMVANASALWDELVHPSGAGYALITTGTTETWQDEPTLPELWTFETGVAITDSGTLRFGTDYDASMYYDNEGEPADGLLRISATGVNRVYVTVDDSLYIGTTEISFPAFELEYIADDTNPTEIKILKTSNTPGDDDEISVISFYGIDSNSTEQRFAHILAKSLDVTDTDTGGSLEFWVTVDSGEYPFLQLKGYNGVVGEPEVIGNESGLDMVWRLETLGVTDALVLDGSQVTLGGLSEGMVNSAANGVLSVLTAAANQVTFWTTNSDIGGDAGFTYDSSANEITLDSNLYIPSVFDDAIQGPNGFEKDPDGDPPTDSTITYDPATREIEIAPTGASFNYWLNGRRHTISSGQSDTHANTTGGYFFYWDSTNTLQFSTTPWSIINDVPIAYVYYNATLTDGIYFEERHGATRNVNWHYSDHYKRGTYWHAGEGLGISGYTLSPGSPADSDNQWAIASGEIHDEDIAFAVTGRTAGSYEIFYRDGATGVWTWATNNVPLLSSGTYIYYNEWTGATWQQTALANNNYVNYYIIATTSLDSDYDIFVIQGQAVYSTLIGAQAETITDIDFGDVPVEEILSAYKVTFRTSAAYSTEGKCRIEAVDDTRLTTGATIISASPGTEHNSLGGLFGDSPYYHSDQETSVASSPTFAALTVSGTAPIITLTDTDTGADTTIDADNATGSLVIEVDVNEEAASSALVLAVDGANMLVLTGGGAAEFTNITGVSVQTGDYVGVTSDVRFVFNTTSGYIDATLGDAAGADEFRVVDSGGSAAATIDSDGHMVLTCATGAAGIALFTANASEGGGFMISDLATSGFLPAFDFESFGVNGWGGIIRGVIPSGNDTRNVGRAAIGVRGQTDVPGALSNAIVFQVQNYTTELFQVEANGNALFNTTTNDAQCSIDQSSTSGAEPVLKLDQADVSEEFIRFVGSAAAATLTQSIVAEADVTTATRAGFVKVYVQDDGNQITDQAYYMPLYTLA